MRTIKIRFIKHGKNKYTIQRKGWFRWKDIGYSVDMGYGGFYEIYSAETKEDLLSIKTSTQSKEEDGLDGKTLHIPLTWVMVV